jgi:N-acetylmuramoyl-L-alanine amidase
MAAARAEIENAAGRAAGDAGPAPTEEVLLVLSDMARRSAVRRADAAAAALVAAIDRDLGVAAAFPRQSGRFAVLTAPDMPSVLLEIGFLSNLRDRRNMTSQDWRGDAAEAIAVAIDEWAVAHGRNPGAQ